MNYYYNETEKSFAVTTNFAYNPIPNGYREITEEEYKELQEELNAQNESEENEIPKVEYNENI
jgi:hypothetical protein